MEQETGIAALYAEYFQGYETGIPFSAHLIRIISELPLS
jgi:hypothetical protein